MQVFFFLLCALMKIKYLEPPQIQGPKKIIVLSFSGIRMSRMNSIGVEHVFCDTSELEMEWELSNKNHTLMYFSCYTNDCTMYSYSILHRCYEIGIMEGLLFSPQHPSSCLCLAEYLAEINTTVPSLPTSKYGQMIEVLITEI